MNDTHSPYRKRLTRSRHEKMLGGVCGGLADFFGIDPTLVRVLVVVISLSSLGTAAVAYLVAWLLMPQEY